MSRNFLPRYTGDFSAEAYTNGLVLSDSVYALSVRSPSCRCGFLVVYGHWSRYCSCQNNYRHRRARLRNVPRHHHPTIHKRKVNFFLRVRNLDDSRKRTSLDVLID